MRGVMPDVVLLVFFWRITHTHEQSTPSRRVITRNLVVNHVATCQQT